MIRDALYCEYLVRNRLNSGIKAKSKDIEILSTLFRLKNVYHKLKRIIFFILRDYFNIVLKLIFQVTTKFEIEVR